MSFQFSTAKNIFLLKQSFKLEYGLPLLQVSDNLLDTLIAPCVNKLKASY